MTKKEIGIMIIILGTVLIIGWFILCIFLTTIGKVNLGLEQYDIYHLVATSIYYLAIFIGIILQE